MNCGTQLRSSAVCPHCKHNNSLLLDHRWYAQQIVVCDTNTGGCDNPFVAAIKLTAVVEVYTLKKVEAKDE